MWYMIIVGSDEMIDEEKIRFLVAVFFVSVSFFFFNDTATTEIYTE